MISTVKDLASRGWLLVALLLLWWFGTASSESLFFPPLAKIMADFRDLWLFEHTLTDLLPSLGRLLLGYSLAVVGGVGLGLLLGLWRPFEESVRPILEFVRAIPGTAMVPIFMIFLGNGTEMRVAMIGMVAAWPILLNTIDGVRAVDPTLNQVAGAFHIKRRMAITHIVLPSAAPQIFAGARVGLSIGIIAMVVVEMVGRPGGIGHFVLSSQRQFDLTAMWSGLIVLGIVGYAANLLFKLVEKKVLWWHINMQSRHKEA